MWGWGLEVGWQGLPGSQGKCHMEEQESSCAFVYRACVSPDGCEAEVCLHVSPEIMRQVVFGEHVPLSNIPWCWGQGVRCSRKGGRQEERAECVPQLRQSWVWRQCMYPICGQARPRLCNL